MDGSVDNDSIYHFNQSTNERTNERINERTKKRKNEWTNEGRISREKEGKSKKKEY